MPFAAAEPVLATTDNGVATSYGLNVAQGRGITFVEPKLASEVTTTAVVAGVQSREVMKLLNGRRDLLIDAMFYYDGNRNVSDVLQVAINPECPNHQAGVRERAAKGAGRAKGKGGG